MTQKVLVECVDRLIYLVRGHKVMLDSDLAELYGVKTEALNQAVKRNRGRFPKDFMFQLSAAETRSLRSQFVISNNGRGGRRYLPYVFTELGVAMLSSVLQSERAIQTNIAIMRAFAQMRQMAANNKELAKKFLELERRLEGHDQQIHALFEAIRQLIGLPEPPRRRIGFHAEGGNLTSQIARSKK